MVTLALDIGLKRIGVAVSDELGMLASPHCAIQRRSTAQALDAVARMVRETGAEQVVVGLPISFDGALHAQARAVQAFAGRLGARIGIPLVYVDETLSSVRAEESLRAAGVRPERIRERVDAAAAAVILQDFLDRRQPAIGAPSAPSETASDTTDERNRDDDRDDDRDGG